MPDSLFSRPLLWRLALFTVALIAAAAVLFAGRGSPPPLAQGAYVWQRVWDTELRDSLQQSRDFLSALHVLGLQRDARGQWVEPAVDLQLLARDGRAVTLVVRIDGSAPDWPVQELSERLQAVLQRWRAAGVQAGVEIDHDCATARLGEYALQLAELRRRLPASPRIAITALPDWLRSPQLDALLQQADTTTLQVHAVQSPASGLFDAALAQRWVEAWAARATPQRPFRVALPAYGARLKLDADGGIDAVESEQPLPRRSAQSRELKVDPHVIADFLHWLRAQKFSSLAGVTWFRLPRAGDSRAWSLTTLRAVAGGEVLSVQWQADLQTQAGGALDLLLRNGGNRDAALPARLRVTGDCPGGDAINGYRLRREGNAAVFEREADGELRAGSGRVLGWVRCKGSPQVRIEDD